MEGQWCAVRYEAAVLGGVSSCSCLNVLVKQGCFRLHIEASHFLPAKRVCIP